MENRILEDMLTYLGDDVSESDVPVILILIRRAVNKVCAKRYPFGYTEDERNVAVERYQNTIFEAAIYYWAKQGAVGESSHSENSISRSYESEDSLYYDVVPMIKVL